MFDNLTDTEVNLLISLTGLVWGIITFIGGYFLGKRNIRYQEFLRASREFRNAFSPALVELDPIDDVKEGYTQDTFSFNIITNHFDSQRLAVQVFSDFLGWFLISSSHSVKYLSIKRFY